MSGAPEDLQDGGNLGILARDVRILCGDVKELKTDMRAARVDIAYLKGRIAGSEIKINGSAKIKVALIGAVATSFSAIVVALISTFS